jgi:hypothetical protein
MANLAENARGAFDIAELTHETTGEAIAGMVLPVSETALKERLFLLSNVEASNNKPLEEAVNKSVTTKPKRTINRKQIIYDDTFTHNGKTYRVNSKKSGLYVEILKPIIEQFEIGLKKWRRVFVLRCDLHTKVYTKDNAIITAFRKRLNQRLKRYYGFKEIGSCWVREQERAKTQHYHFVLFLDGNLIRHSSKINELVRAAWDDGTGTYTMPHIPRPYHFVDSEDTMQDAIYRVSYLAKPRGKGYRPPQTKDFQCSRMKAKGLSNVNSL